MNSAKHRHATTYASALFTPDEQIRISDAITRAEQSTCGEIVAVVASESASYRYVPLLWASLLALLVPWPLIYLTWMPVQTIFLAQLAAFLTLLIALMPPAVRMALVPRSVKHAHAHRRAVEQFLVQNLHTTEGRTGVLVYVSVAEHYAGILADTGIAAKVPQAMWQDIVDRLTACIGDGKPADGFVTAVTDIGALLAQHFPPGSANANELPNKLIMLD
ncbi:MAG: TPM domain-containing protein [Hyphomicrobiaceae bacterium]